MSIEDELKFGTCEIAVAHWPQDMEEARSLLSHYGSHLAASSIAATGFCLAGYEAEIRSLPGKYATERADLLLARVNGEAAGCVAIIGRVLADGTDVAEVKRLWVEPGFRGHHLGRKLMESAINWARGHGSAAAVLDTVHEAMPQAAELYVSLGFKEVERFNDNPVEGVRFYKLALR